MCLEPELFEHTFYESPVVPLPEQDFCRIQFHPAAPCFISCSETTLFFNFNFRLPLLVGVRWKHI